MRACAAPPHGPRDPAHAVPAVAAEAAIRGSSSSISPSTSSWRWRLPRRHRLVPRGWPDPSLPRPTTGARDRRLRGRAYFSCTSAHTCTAMVVAGAMPALPLQDTSSCSLHPDRHRGSGCLVTEGARGEVAGLINPEGGALAMELRADREGPRLARRRLPRHVDGDPRRPRRRPAQGPHLPTPGTPGRGHPARTPPPAFPRRRRSSPAWT